MDNIYKSLKIPVYEGIDFANLLKYDYGFFLDWKPKTEDYKNEHQIFTWKMDNYLDIILQMVKYIKKNICIYIIGVAQQPLRFQSIKKKTVSYLCRYND